tara:strand:+ start:173 stop:700 length:528 start_codon:yes stop_codon:yes gene_type:complete
MLTQDKLKELLRYENGFFYWVSRSKGVKRADMLAGSVRNTGYRAIRISGKLYQEHQLTYLYHFGSLKAGCIDHIDGNRVNNKLSNLRLVTRSQNAMNKCIQSNNTSGHVGVFKRKDTGKWTAYIGKGKVTIDGKTVKSGRTYLGSFKTMELAMIARADAEKEIHKEFAFNENRSN